MTRDSGFGTRDSGLGTRDSGLGTRDSGLGTRDSGLGTRDSGLGTRDSGLGIRAAGFGIRDNITTPSFRGCRRQNPESILTLLANNRMDSGFRRNDERLRSGRQIR